MLPPKKRIVSIRAKVPQNTPVNSPVSLNTELQNPIIEEIHIFATGANLNESGFRVLFNGIQAIPVTESVSTPDMATGSNFIAFKNATQKIEIGAQVPGSPYKIEVQFYNLSVSADYYASIELLTAPKIELPDMPIEKDKVSKKPEYDS